MKTEALRQALDAHGFDVIFGGARRDEEASRAKERICSFRPQAIAGIQGTAPGAVATYNMRLRPGERCASSRCRTGPSWTSGDYIESESIPIVPLYFAENARSWTATAP